MKYTGFEDIPVWQKASALHLAVHALCDDRAFWHQRYLKDQMLRAALSIVNNIAEGLESGTTPHLLSYLYRAKGSAAELRGMFIQLQQIPRFVKLNAELAAQEESARDIASQLWKWANYLQHTDIKGQRHLK